MDSIKLGLVTFRTEEELRGLIHQKNEGFLASCGVNVRRVCYLVCSGTWLSNDTIASLIEQKTANNPRERERIYTSLFTDAAISADLTQKIGQVKAVVQRLDLEEQQAKAAAKAADLDKLKKHLPPYSFKEYKSGELPPFFCSYRGMWVALEPPELRQVSPFYHYSPTPAPEPAYEPDEERSRLSPRDRIAWFENELRKLNNQCDGLFKEAQDKYNAFKGRLKDLSPKEIKKEVDALYRILDNLLMPLIDAKAHRGMIRQIYREEFDSHEDSGMKMQKAIQTQYDSLKELLVYLTEYAKWKERENSGTRLIMPPLVADKIVNRLTMSDFSRDTHLGKTVKTEFHALFLHEPRAYEQIKLSKQNERGEWEAVPLFASPPIPDDDRYQVAAIVEPKQTYRMDIVEFRREVGNRGHIETVEKTRTIMLEAS